MSEKQSHDMLKVVKWINASEGCFMRISAASSDLRRACVGREDGDAAVRSTY